MGYDIYEMCLWVGFCTMIISTEVTKYAARVETMVLGKKWGVSYAFAKSSEWLNSIEAILQNKLDNDH